MSKIFTISSIYYITLKKPSFPIQVLQLVFILHQHMESQKMSENLYVVESIVGKKVENGKAFYKVKWLGYPFEECTWEKKSHLKYVSEMIEAYEKLAEPSTTDIDQPQKSLEKPSEEINKLAITQPNEEKDSNQPNSSQDGVSSISSSKQLEHSQKSSEDPLTLPNQRQTSQSFEKRALHLAKKGQTFKKEKNRAEKQSKPKQKRQRTDKKSQKKQKKQRKTLQSSSSYSTGQPDKYVNQCLQQESAEITQSQKKCDHVPITTAHGLELKNQEDDPYHSQQIRIRLIAPTKATDINDYVVEYPNGNIKILNTRTLFYTHPLEFVNYIEAKEMEEKLKKNV